MSCWPQPMVRGLVTPVYSWQRVAYSLASRTFSPGSRTTRATTTAEVLHLYFSILSVNAVPCSARASTTTHLITSRARASAPLSCSSTASLHCRSARSLHGRTASWIRNTAPSRSKRTGSQQPRARKTASKPTWVLKTLDPCIVMCCRMPGIE